MPFFKRKSDQPDRSNRATRLEELEAHVRAIRSAAGGPNASRFDSLEAFVLEDQWPGEKGIPPIKEPPRPVAKPTPPADATTVDTDEAALVAELERYLSQHPESGDSDEPAPLTPPYS